MIMLCISGDEVRRWQRWRGELHLLHAATFEEVADTLRDFFRSPSERFRVGFTNQKAAAWRLTT